MHEWLYLLFQFSVFEVPNKFLIYNGEIIVLAPSEGPFLLYFTLCGPQQATSSSQKCLNNRHSSSLDCWVMTKFTASVAMLWYGEFGVESVEKLGLCSLLLVL